MNSLIEKFVKGIKTDVQGTIVKTIRYAAKIVYDGIADGLFFVFIVPLILLPARTLARIKHTLSPITLLDYNRKRVKLQADSLLDFYRARACEKEPETVHWIETYIHKGDVFYDLGANIGAYSLVACAYCSGEIKILAFEPSFSNFYQLCRNIILNKFDKNITPYMIALSRKPGLLAFNYRSLEAGSADHWLDENLPTASADSVYTQQLLAFSMDYLIEQFGFPIPNHIKLDVDGAEVDVLLGAEKTLRKQSVKSILVEVRDIDDMSGQVHELLLSAGFSLVSRVDRGDGLTWNCIYARHAPITKSK
jgi:FkbM family methyltransferase